MTKLQEFALFKKECLKWAKRWGLEDWRYDFSLKELDGDIADCGTDSINRIITLELSTIKPFSASFIRETAKHEIIHVLIGDLRSLGCARFLTTDEWDAAEHRVVRKLEGLL